MGIGETRRSPLRRQQPSPPRSRLLSCKALKAFGVHRLTTDNNAPPFRGMGRVRPFGGDACTVVRVHSWVFVFGKVMLFIPYGWDLCTVHMTPDMGGCCLRVRHQ